MQMPTLPLVIMIAGLLGTLFVLYSAFAGPSPARAGARRLEVLRERHSRSSDVIAQAQLKRIIAIVNPHGRARQTLPAQPRPAQAADRADGHGMGLLPVSGGKRGLVVVVATLVMFQGLPFLLAISAGLFAGVSIPHFTVGFLIKRRVNKFTSRFPDAIELMVRGLRSGLPISETIGIVGNEIAGPVSEEFMSVSDKMKIGRTMEVALQETADRLGTPEFQFFVITLAIQRETGGNLAETLANLADVLRKRAQMKLKIKAMSSESKASAYIIGSLPFIVFGLIYSINPGYMGDFFTDQRLMIAGIGGMFWMSIGAAIMAKMINFEI
jgi:tight adherence protein B